MKDEASDTGKAEDFPLKILAHNNLVGRIIGKQGATIKRIMDETNTKITVSSINEINAFNVERVITVKGEIEDMAKAEAEISAKLRAAYEGDVQVMAPQMAMYSGIHPAMMGIGYGTGMPVGIRQGGQVSGNVPYYSNFNGNATVGVSSGGQAVDTNGLATAMGGMALRPPFQMPPQEVCNVFIPSSSVGAVIGAKGTYIRQVIRLTGATIKIAPNDEEPATNGEAPTSASSLLPPSTMNYRRVTIVGTCESQFKVSLSLKIPSSWPRLTKRQFLYRHSFASSKRFMKISLQLEIPTCVGIWK